MTIMLVLIAKVYGKKFVHYCVQSFNMLNEEEEKR